MSRFRRRGRDDDSDPAGVDDADDADDAQAVVEDDENDSADADGGSTGPWDESEIDDPAAGGRVSLGGLWIPGRPGLEVRIEADETSGAIIAVTLVLAGSALQVQPFAAPRTEGIWTDVRQEIKASITKQGGTADDVEGPFGPELRTKVPARKPDGGSAAQAARFLGVDGPRWFLRGVLTGAAAESEQAAADLVAVFRDIVVARGSEAMAPREPIPLRLPTEMTESPAGAAADEDEDSLKPFERGPEITEIH